MSGDTWARLVDAHNDAEHRSTYCPDRRPLAAVLACADARVPPSVVFDQPAGRLFVIRLAGNTAVPAALASLDHAVATLDVDTVVVMGHTDCGAVRAAVEGTCGGHLAPVVSSICELAAAHPDATTDAIATLNVVRTVRDLQNHDGPVGEAYRNGRLDIRGARHDVVTGQLEAVPIPDPLPPPPVAEEAST